MTSDSHLVSSGMVSRWSLCGLAEIFGMILHIDPESPLDKKSKLLFRRPFNTVLSLSLSLSSFSLSSAQRVISEEKGQCYRVLGPGNGAQSCSLPILKNITKQICCCSRVGKAWGANCQRCPYFASGRTLHPNPQHLLHPNPQSLVHPNCPTISPP